MARRVRRRRWPAAVAVLLLAALVLARLRLDAHRPDVPESLPEQIYAIDRVVDGDTLKLQSGARVRLIGIDTPESVKPNHPVEPFGPEASEFTRRFLVGGRARLQFDRERKDQYDRFLAYVWVDDRMLNEELLRAGLARALLHHRYDGSMKLRFKKAEKEAKEHRRGIWQQEESR